MIRLWTLWMAILMHMLWGVILLASKEVENQVFIYRLRDWCNCSGGTIGIILIMVSVLAVVGLIVNGKRQSISLILIFPQTVLLLLHAGFSILSIVDGETPIGGEYDCNVLLMTFLPVILIAVLQIITLVEYHWRLSEYKTLEKMRELNK